MTFTFISLLLLLFSMSNTLNFWLSRKQIHYKALALCLSQDRALFDCYALAVQQTYLRFIIFG